MQERRGQERFQLATVKGSTLSGIGVDIIDMSMGGAQITTSDCLVPGREYTVRLEGKRAVWLMGVVVWASGGKGREVYGKECRAGIRLTGFCANMDTQLHDFLETHRKY
jgi:hypothetical protein